MADIYLKDKSGSKVPYYNVNSVSFDGLAEGTQEVFVASGSQTKVQSDWYENDTTADSYVKNRPGGYYTTLEGKTYTFDGTVVGKETVSSKEGMTLVKVTNDVVVDSQISTITSLSVNNNGTIQTVDVFSANKDGIQVLITNGEVLDGKLSYPMWVANLSEAIATKFGVTKGLYFCLFTKTQTGDATNIYPTSITTTPVKITQPIPQEFLSVKQSDWSAYPGSLFGITDGYIKNRLGGFIDSSGISTELTFDGIVEGKERYQIAEGIILVKALDYPLTKSQISSIQVDSISVVAGGTTYSAKNKSIKLDNSNFMGYVLNVTITIGSSDETNSYLVSCPVGTIIPDTGAIIPPGTYFIFLNSSSATSYLSAATVSATIINKLPSEFIDTDFGSAYVFANGVIIPSSTSGSTKKYKITVNDEGVISAVLYSS